jgi:hypothetical protein
LKKPRKCAIANEDLQYQYQRDTAWTAQSKYLTNPRITSSVWTAIVEAEVGVAKAVEKISPIVLRIILCVWTVIAVCNRPTISGSGERGAVLTVTTTSRTDPRITPSVWTATAVRDHPTRNNSTAAVGEGSAVTAEKTYPSARIPHSVLRLLSSGKVLVKEITPIYILLMQYIGLRTHQIDICAWGDYFCHSWMIMNECPACGGPRMGSPRLFFFQKFLSFVNPE